MKKIQQQRTNTLDRQNITWYIGNVIRRIEKVKTLLTASLIEREVFLFYQNTHKQAMEKCLKTIF